MCSQAKFERMNGYIVYLGLEIYISKYGIIDLLVYVFAYIVEFDVRFRFFPGPIPLDIFCAIMKLPARIFEYEEGITKLLAE